MVNWFDYSTATDSKVSWDWVEAATNTVYSLSLDLITLKTAGLVFTKSKSLQNQRDLHKLQVLTFTLIFTAFSKAKCNFLGVTTTLANSRPETLSGML